MFEILDSDLGSLKDFPLKWRWTDERWNLLPLEISQKIIPLTERKAEEIDKIHRQYLSSDGLDDEIFQKIETIGTETTDILVVQNWLKSRILIEQNYIVISWNQKLAVKTTWEIFCNYWDDFCYPASDDITISSADLTWLLFYFHEEYISFGKVKEELL